MIVKKPTVIIYTRDPDEDFLREICAGIEEEGVLYEIHSRDTGMDELAFEAAKDSMLGSGIGIEEQRIAMQMAKLPRGKNVFELNNPRFWQCRNLGANSARAVKKMPFKPVYGENREMSL
ncbi:glycerol dehydratase reactivase beta/small subunit family protein [Blautia sp. XA-2221]|uniref:glycerol dehydratase reactivase beta/small subunit family protein n=1 Tax=Blautia sp. XA-2221 TaxID=2903961 RepID=UPI002379602A|nr:glycerol dehydratase reactivase beta/small subunit family protein [Blautia sp. XA-2221]